MASLFHKVKLYLEANGKTDKEIGHEMNGANVFLVNDSDGNGDYIKVWNVSGLIQPTEEQLNSYSSQAEIAATNAAIVDTRKKLYGTPEQQIEILVEQGVDKLIERNIKIKTDNPKG